MTSNFKSRLRGGEVKLGWVEKDLTSGGIEVNNLVGLHGKGVRSHSHTPAHAILKTHV